VIHPSGLVPAAACGTLPYVAPEVLRRDMYGTQVDMWSFGVVLYTVLSGHMPWASSDRQVLTDTICAGKYVFPADTWSSVGVLARMFVSQLLQVDPAKRMGARQALQHPWFTTARVNQHPPLGLLQRLRQRCC
jgi:serine/threonine protein kinase